MDTTYFEGSPDNWQEYKNYTLENVDGKQYDQNLKLTSNFLSLYVMDFYNTYFIKSDNSFLLQLNIIDLQM